MYFMEQIIEIGWTFIKANIVLIISIVVIDFWRRLIMRLIKNPKKTKFNDGSNMPIDFFGMRKGGRNDPPSGKRPLKPTGLGSKPDNDNPTH